MQRIVTSSCLSLFVLLASCSPASSPDAKTRQALASAKSEANARTTEKTTIIASVAASTIDVMEKLVQEFGKQAPDVEIKLNAGPSSGLASQIISGAPADLFLSANEQWAAEVKKAGRSAESAPLLTNSLVLVTPKDNPAGVDSPEDLLSDKVEKVSLAGEQVPAGMYADQALKSLELQDQLAAAGKIVRGQDVRAALSYVERGEAEAGIVYSTDVASAPGVAVVHKFDPKLHDKIVYVLVLVKQDDQPSEAAREFFKFLQSDAAAGVFQQFGFERIDGEDR